CDILVPEFRYSVAVALSLFSTAVGRAQVGQAATVTAVAGQGQVIQTNFPTNTPLTVLVKDDKGNPVSGAAVNWSVTHGQGAVAPQSTTGSTGQASAFFIAPNVVYPVSFVQSVVSASIGPGRITAD